MADEKLTYINVGPRGTFKKSGALVTTPGDVDANFEHLTSTGAAKLAGHFRSEPIQRRRPMHNLKKMLSLSPFALAVTVQAGPAFAWGDEGHEIVALIAEHYLDDGVRSKVQQILGGDTSHLTLKDVAHEATWADKYRDSDRHSTKKIHYNRTHNWHFVDLELQGPDLTSACSGRPALPHGTPASRGPSQDCVVDKIDEFATELANTSTSVAERRMSLQFLLHFVGDIHQPLHASDDKDQGGNLKLVTASGLHPGKLHSYWDTELVQQLGSDQGQVAQILISKITDTDRTNWSKGTPAEWAQESFEISKHHSYGMLPTAASPNHYTLSIAYVTDATKVISEQLSKAGVRLAFVLNAALK